MLKIKNLILYFVLCVPLLVASQNNLTILVEDVDSSEGYIAVGVYTDTESFLKDGKEFTGVFAKAETGTTRIVLFDLPNDIYAISLFHDKNGNKEMDTNFLGIPKEPLGFSFGKLKTFGPPSFEECSFDMKSDYEINISVE